MGANRPLVQSNRAVVRTLFANDNETVRSHTRLWSPHTKESLATHLHSRQPLRQHENRDINRPQRLTPRVPSHSQVHTLTNGQNRTIPIQGGTDTRAATTTRGYVNPSGNFIWNSDLSRTLNLREFLKTQYIVGNHPGWRSRFVTNIKLEHINKQSNRSPRLARLVCANLTLTSGMQRLTC